MSQISYHQSVNDTQACALADSGPFARATWFALLEADEPAPLYACTSTGDKALCLPLRQRGDCLEALTNWYAFTFAPLSAGPAPDPALARLLAQALAGRARKVCLDKLAAEDGTLALLEDAFRAAGWFTLPEPSHTNHYLDLAGRDYVAYRASLPGPLRTTLSRKAHRVEVRLASRFDPRDWDAYQAVYAASWKPAEGDPVLLRRFAMAESDAGRYRLALAFSEGRPVAAQFWTVDGACALIHKLAHREDAAALSPGTTLTAALMQQVIDRDGVSLVDFGTGDDAYKRNWMNRSRPRFRLTAWRPLRMGNWPGMGRALARRLVSTRPAG